MKRTIKSYFKCSREELNRLFACNRISALIWNKILDLQREKLRSKDELQKALKGFYQSRRKTPCFSYGDISRKKKIAKMLVAFYNSEKILLRGEK